VRNHVRPWIDSGQKHGYEDVFTISQIGDLEVKLHAAEALLERAGRAIDEILDDPSDEAVAETAVKVAEAKVLTTEVAILATNKLHDPVRWKYFHVGNHLLNGVAPPRHAWS
jgi:alkylation response protein AidB-like acyl-CoA dehydrogenase